MYSNSLESVRRSLKDYKRIIDSAKDVKNVVELFVNAEPQLPKAETVAVLKEDLSVEVMYTIEILTALATLFLILWDYLALNELTYVQSSSSNRIYTGMENRFCNFERNRDYALKFMQDIVSSLPGNYKECNVDSTNAMGIIENSVDSEQKLAHNI